MGTNGAGSTGDLTRRDGDRDVEQDDLPGVT